MSRMSEIGIQANLLLMEKSMPSLAYICDRILSILYVVDRTGAVSDSAESASELEISNALSASKIFHTDRFKVLPRRHIHPCQVPATCLSKVVLLESTHLRIRCLRHLSKTRSYLSTARLKLLSTSSDSSITIANARAQGKMEEPQSSRLMGQSRKFPMTQPFVQILRT